MVLLPAAEQAGESAIEIRPAELPGAALLPLAEPRAGFDGVDIDPEREQRGCIPAGAGADVEHPLALLEHEREERSYPAVRRLVPVSRGSRMLVVVIQCVLIHRDARTQCAMSDDT